MELNNVALHETMQLHELLNAKTVGITKSKLIQGLVFDQELRALLDKDVKWIDKCWFRYSRYCFKLNKRKLI